MISLGKGTGQKGLNFDDDDDDDDGDDLPRD
jgi:hypothetical protein